MYNFNVDAINQLSSSIETSAKNEVHCTCKQNEHAITSIKSPSGQKSSLTSLFLHHDRFLPICWTKENNTKISPCIQCTCKNYHRVHMYAS